MIQIDNLEKVYKSEKIAVKALKGISFTIAPKDFVSIMGPSGSGKSTLMNILGCLDKPSKGTYLLDGIEVSNLNSKELAKVRNNKIGFVFQTFNLLPRLSCLSNVELPMIYAGVSEKKRRKKALEALERVGLSKRIDHHPNEISGGQRQRVAIARSLVNDPAILLADEPTGNLDTRSGEEVMSIFQELNHEGVTIVLVTHELDIAEHTNKIIHFRDGLLEKEEVIIDPIDAKDVLLNLPKQDEV